LPTTVRNQTDKSFPESVVAVSREKRILGGSWSAKLSLMEAKMSYLAFDRIGHNLHPNEVSDLQVVFDRICKDCGVSKSNSRAEHAAAVLIRSYQRGIEDPNLLADIGRAVMRSVV
jgi:hypothetical protein